MIRTQRHSRFVLMSLDEIRATRDIVLQTEETKSNFSGSGKTVYICEVVRPCDYQKETDTAADKLAAEIERVNADNRALRRKVERLERELRWYMKMPLRMAGGSRNGNCPKSLCFAFRSLRRLWKNTGAGGLFYTSRAMLAGYVAKKTEARIAEAGHTIRKIRTRLVRRRVKSRKAWRWNWPIA